jgi:rhodanese-related sulfurtransferase
MVTLLLACWCVCATVVLLWCALGLSSRDFKKTLKGRLHYVVISPAMLSEWEVHEPNLIIVDLRPKLNSGRNDDEIANSLRIPVASLATALRWIPPATRLVFCGCDWSDPFNTVVEDVLLCAGIEAVYLLDGGIEAWHAFVAQNGALLRRGSAAALPEPEERV